MESLKIEIVGHDKGVDLNQRKRVRVGVFWVITTNENLLVWRWRILLGVYLPFHLHITGCIVWMYRKPGCLIFAEPLHFYLHVIECIVGMDWKPGCRIFAESWISITAPLHGWTTGVTWQRHIAFLQKKGTKLQNMVVATITRWKSKANRREAMESYKTLKNKYAYQYDAYRPRQ